MFIYIISYIIQNFVFFALQLTQSSFPRPLSAKAEKELFELMAIGDNNARDKLISHNLRLVAHIININTYKKIQF